MPRLRLSLSVLLVGLVALSIAVAPASSAATDRDQLVGHFDSLTSQPGGGLSVSGWTLDVSRGDGQALAYVFVDGKLFGYLSSNVERSDVNAAMHTTGIHGFWYILAVSNNQWHNVCISTHDMRVPGLSKPMKKPFCNRAYNN